MVSILRRRIVQAILSKAEANEVTVVKTPANFGIERCVRIVSCSIREIMAFRGMAWVGSLPSQPACSSGLGTIILICQSKTPMSRNLSWAISAIQLVRIGE